MIQFFIAFIYAIISFTTISLSAQGPGWVKGIGGSALDGGESIFVDATGNVMVVGNFGSTVDFDPGPGISNLSTGGTGSGFILKLDGLGDLCGLLNLKAPIPSLSLTLI